jgi:hypothetical protein
MAKMLRREVFEWLTIIVMGVVILSLSKFAALEQKPWLLSLAVGFCLAKTTYYVLETLWHLRRATTLDLPYHEFVLLIAYNMVEVTFSFAVDYYCLVSVEPQSLLGVDPVLQGSLLLFECFYFSVLNFSYFGYGDITPGNVFAKIVVLTEIVTAFSTVIFLLSDFISMKESIRKSNSENVKGAQPKD